mmetsp:Transcript_23387/g.60129  ORF Transcript_23387/g.60129 Transcript_23387/m.60129 type:complete len:230 (-) Transcript_23387:675-1364(-)
MNSSTARAFSSSVAASPKATSSSHCARGTLWTRALVATSTSQPRSTRVDGGQCEVPIAARKATQSGPSRPLTCAQLLRCADASATSPRISACSPLMKARTRATGANAACDVPGRTMNSIAGSWSKLSAMKRAITLAFERPPALPAVWCTRSTWRAASAMRAADPAARGHRSNERTPKRAGLGAVGTSWTNVSTHASLSSHRHPSAIHVGSGLRACGAAPPTCCRRLWRR